jgi:hypothetical protein
VVEVVRVVEVRCRVGGLAIGVGSEERILVLRERWTDGRSQGWIRGAQRTARPSWSL